ncbi:hypothetical protein BFN67_10735 [Pseudaminobacter manganicus]|uniref:Uncharacterized protein n=2 Tax=Manganibacter manganicus TaxID=1873176 RepID=A0A1V8RVM7_9HYPH|nr:hypothetical protein BFN67_10735 [Pseudaminobacter manganicus]
MPAPLPRLPLEIAEPALLIAMSGFETVPRPATYEISNIANALAPTQPREDEKFPDGPIVGGNLLAFSGAEPPHAFR